MAKKGHNWNKLKKLPWFFCWPGCGLAWLNNPISQKAAKAPCRWHEEK